MSEWFDQPRPGEGASGLRFSCTMCGRCCSGPEGYVAFTDDEASRLAARLGIGLDEFLQHYTQSTPSGRSLAERHGPFGYDCIFLDRKSFPGRAVCGVYEDRPTQCRTWPFWESNLSSELAWERAARVCPGINSGPRHAPIQIRIERARVRI